MATGSSDEPAEPWLRVDLDVAAVQHRPTGTVVVAHPDLELIHVRSRLGQVVHIHHEVVAPAAVDRRLAEDPGVRAGHHQGDDLRALDGPTRGVVLESEVPFSLTIGV